MTGKDVFFYRVVEDAKKQGVPELVIEKLALDILFMGNYKRAATDALVKYMKKNGVRRMIGLVKGRSIFSSPLAIYSLAAFFIFLWDFLFISDGRPMLQNPGNM